MEELRAGNLAADSSGSTSLRRKRKHREAGEAPSS